MTKQIQVSEMPVEDERLVTAEELLQLAWTPKARPSIQWLRMHTGHSIPVVRVGRLCFYSPSAVRKALNLSTPRSPE